MSHECEGYDDCRRKEAEALLAQMMRDTATQAFEQAAQLINRAQIFHCWGSKDIDGIQVRNRLVETIRAAAPK